MRVVLSALFQNAFNLCPTHCFTFQSARRRIKVIGCDSKWWLKGGVLQSAWAILKTSFQDRKKASYFAAGASVVGSRPIRRAAKNGCRFQLKRRLAADDFSSESTIYLNLTRK